MSGRNKNRAHKARVWHMLLIISGKPKCSHEKCSSHDVLWYKGTPWCVPHYKKLLDS